MIAPKILTVRARFTSKTGQMINIFATIPIDIRSAPLQVNVLTIHGHNIEKPKAPHQDEQSDSNLMLPIS